MNNRLTRILAVSFALTILVGVLTSCNRGGNTDTTGDTTLMSMAPADNNWRGALPTDKDKTVTEVYETQTQVTKTKLTGMSLDKVTTFGSSGNDMFSRVVATPDGGFAAIGLFGAANGDCKEAKPSWTGTKSMLVKYDKSGTVEWSTFLGGDNGATFNALARLANGSYIIAGQTQSTDLGAKLNAAIEGLVVCYSAEGKLEWTKIVGGTKNEYFSSAAATPDGGFIIGGKTESSDGDFAGLKAGCIKAVLIKYDSTGAPRWKRALNGSKHNNFEGLAVNSNGDIFAACYTMSNDMDFAKIAGRGEADTLIFKYDKTGAFIWVNSFSGSGIDELTSVAVSPDGGCVIGGMYSIMARNDGSFKPYFNAGSFDGFMVKFNKNGSIGWTKPVAGFKNDRILGIAAVDGGYVAVGTTESSNRDFAYMSNLGLQDGFALLVDVNGKTINLIALAGSNDDVPRAVTSAGGSKIIVVGGTKSSDSTFNGIEPAAGNDTFNCFTASFSTSF